MSFHDNLLSRKGRMRTAASAKVQRQIAEDIERAKTLDIVLPQKLDPETPDPACLSDQRGERRSSDTELGDAIRPSTEPPFSVRKLSERWGCSEGAVRSVIRNGDLGHFRVGDLIRVPAEEVRRFECRR